MGKYDDIIHLSRPDSSHPKMRREDRAKIFAPFAALSGHSEAVHAREAVLVPQVAMTEHTRDILDRKLRQIHKGDMITVVYFVPQKRQFDELYGEYLTVTATVVRVDPIERVLHLQGREVLFDDLLDIRGEGLNGLEDYDAIP